VIDSLQASVGNLMPVLFVSHGAPTFALEPGSTGPALTAWSKQLQQRTGLPKAVVVMSPHWMSSGLRVMTQSKPPTWHDFGGFPPALYELQYPAPGQPLLAAQVLDLLAQAGLSAQADAQQAFDHGAWVPMMHLFPEAQVPMVQVSLPNGAGPAEVYAIGQALASLRAQGVLLLGSGSMTHNLSEFRSSSGSAALPDVLAFSQWIEAGLLASDKEALLDYRRRAPYAVRAHPTDEHFLTLYFALGAAAWGANANVQINYLSREVMFGMLSMDALSLN